MTFFSTPARRCLAAILLLFIALLPVTAGQNYYYAEVSVISGSGSVYISKQNTSNPTETSVNGNNRSGSTTLFLYANPLDEDWEFQKWEVYKNNEYKSTLTQTNTSIEIEYDGSEDRPTSWLFKATFTPQVGAVKINVPSSESTRGTASITSNNDDNKVGGLATLLATPNAANGIHFLGWYKDINGIRTLITKDNPYTIYPITNDNKGTYYAHFSQAPENVYCRIQNTATGRFLTLCGIKAAAKTTDGFSFEKSLKLIYENDAKGNPMTVFLRNGFPVDGNDNIINEANLVANNIQYHNLVTENEYSTEYELTMEETNDGVKIYTSFNGRESYLTDEGGEWATMQSNPAKNIKWHVYKLDGSDTGSFGANAKSEFSGDNNYGESGKYYTTMYTYFPYQLTEGVKAYYLPLAEATFDKDKKEVYFTEVSGGVVPMNSAVILECSDIYDGTNNILIPLMTNQNPSETFQDDNLLTGYISLYDESGEGPNLVENNKSTMYILSKIGQDLGWFHFSAPNMTPNKAFLDLTDHMELLEQNNINVREVKFNFGRDDDEATGIISKRFADDVDGQLFDLNGRRVNNGNTYDLKKGIYISNGKKIVIK